MNDEERRVITAFVERIAGAQQAQGWGDGSVPQARPALPPVDPEADRTLWELFNRYPEARYRITQTAFVQEAALVEATNRIRQLEWEVENARRQGQAMAARAPRGGLFGGRPAVPAPTPMPPPPQPQYPPGYNAQALQQAPGRTGSGFLGTAVATAAGVAGGVVLGSMLMNAFSGGGAAHAGGFGSGGGFGGSSGGGAFGQQPVSGGSTWGSDGGQKADGGSPWGGDNAASSGSSWGQDAGGASSGGWTPDVQPDAGGYSQDSGGYDGGGGSDDN